jgi:hypothetical protein
MKIILSFLSLVLIFSSCMSGKKSMVGNVVKNTGGILQNEAKEVAAVTVKKETALENEKIDTTINNRINIRLVQYKNEMDSMQSSLNFLEKQLASKRDFRKNFKGEITSRILLLERYNGELYLRRAKMNMINESIDISDKKLYEMAAFFGPGVYTIPGEKHEMALSLFTPLIDSMIAFANRYDSIPSSGTLVVNGFADAMDIAPESELYQVLMAHLKKTSAEKAELNTALSGLRATEISNLVENIIQQKTGAFKTPGKVKFNFFGYGQGETLPTKTIKDYNDDDERRRIVLIYWNVLPD